MTGLLPGFSLTPAPTVFPSSAPSPAFRPVVALPRKKPRKILPLLTLTPEQFYKSPASKQKGASYNRYLAFIAKRRAPATQPTVGRVPAHPNGGGTAGGVAPITLTRAQFYRTKAGQQPGATYAKYLTFIAKRRAATPAGPSVAAPAAVDPLAPQSIPSFPELIAQAQTLYGGQDQSPEAMAAAARKQIMDEIGPLRAQFESEAQARLATSLELIKQYTQAYQGMLAPFPGQVRAEYDAARNLTNQQDAALTSFLGSHGTEQGGELAAALGAINAPGASQDLAAAASSGTGAQSADVSAAAANATADRLASTGGAQAAYAATLPGIAALSGLAMSRQVAGQIQSDLAKELSDLDARIPGLIDTLITNLTSSNRSDRNAAVSLAATMFNDAQGRETQKAIARAGFGIDTTKIGASSAKAAADRASRERIARLRARATVSAAASRNQAAKARQDASIAATAARAAADRRSREVIASTRSTAAQKKTAAAQISARDKAVTSAFTRASSAASRMHAGSYGSPGAQAAASGDPFASPTTARPPTPFKRAYNSIYAMLEAQLRNLVSPKGIRRLTLRALAAGGYPVQISAGP